MFLQTFAIPETLDLLLSQVRFKFQLNENKKIKLFTNKGGEIDDVELIRDDEILYARYRHQKYLLNHNGLTLSQITNIPKIISKMSWNRLTNEWIKLNIGGKIFTTTRSTVVAKEPESMLAKMFECGYYSNNCGNGTAFTTNDIKNNTTDCDENIESNSESIKENNDMNSCKNDNKNYSNLQHRHTCIVPSLLDDQGAYMIDRSPEYFEPLIGYLRHGNLIIDKHLNPMGILEEAKFYGFYSIIPQLEAIVLQESLLQNTIERSIGLAPLTRKDVIKAIIQTSTDTKLRFQGVNMAGADLSKLDLSNINFKYAIFRDANLQGATLNNCCLERADMSKCNLEGALLINCRMVCCNLEGSVLRGSNMNASTFRELTNLEGANLNVIFLKFIK